MRQSVDGRELTSDTDGCSEVERSTGQYLLCPRMEVRNIAVRVIRTIEITRKETVCACVSVRI